MSTPIKCPECGGAKLTYEKHEEDHVNDFLESVDLDGQPYLTTEGTQRWGENYEQVRCVSNGECNAVWPSWDDFLACFQAENHDEECVLA